MKKGIHPEDYRFVVFKDMSNDYAFLGKSTAPSKETIKWEDGNEYPLIKLEISHKSHPFFTGKMQFVDSAGRIDKFRSKYERHLKGKPAAKTEEPKAEAAPAEEAPVEEPKAEEVEPVEAATEEPTSEAAAEETPAEEPQSEEAPAEDSEENKDEAAE